MASKKQKKIAEFNPFERALGPTPLKKGLSPLPSLMTDRAAPMKDGLELAEHIITVFTTSKGVVAAAAAAPAMPPMTRSSATLAGRPSESWP